MTAPIDKVLDEGNCGRATDRGEEACECVRKYRPDFAVGHILVQAARLRTETSYQAGSGRRVSTTSRSRSQTPAQVNDELAQRSITFLSGETCQAACEPPFASMSRACPKDGNFGEQSPMGEAGVSRGRSTASSSSTDDRKDRTLKNKDEHSLTSNRGGSPVWQVDSVLRPERTGSAASVLPALRSPCCGRLTSASLRS